MTWRRTTQVAAAALAALSLGLPWSAFVHGYAHTMRVTGAVGAVLVAAGVRAGRTGIAWAGVAVAALALPIGIGGTVGSGRVTYALAIAAVVLSLRPAAPTPPAPT